MALPRTSSPDVDAGNRGVCDLLVGRRELVVLSECRAVEFISGRGNENARNVRIKACVRKPPLAVIP